MTSDVTFSFSINFWLSQTWHTWKWRWLSCSTPNGGALIKCRQPENNALNSPEHIQPVTLYSMEVAYSRDTELILALRLQQTISCRVCCKKKTKKNSIFFSSLPFSKQTLSTLFHCIISSVKWQIFRPPITFVFFDACYWGMRHVTGDRIAFVIVSADGLNEAKTDTL